MRFQFDDLTFDPDTRQLWIGKKEARLSPKAFDLLALLIERRPKAVSKVDIRQHLWPGELRTETILPRRHRSEAPHRVSAAVAAA